MTTKKHCSKTKRFSDEDQIRVARMREEIIARLTEISLIMARTLDIAPPSDIREFTITDGPAGESLEISVIKTSGPSAAGGTATITSWGCTCHANKVCCSAPCPPCT